MASIYENNAARQRAYRERYRERIESRIELTEERIARIQQAIEDLNNLLHGMGMWEPESTKGRSND